MAASAAWNMLATANARAHNLRSLPSNFLGFVFIQVFHLGSGLLW